MVKIGVQPESGEKIGGAIVGVQEVRSSREGPERHKWWCGEGTFMVRLIGRLRKALPGPAALVANWRNPMTDWRSPSLTHVLPTVGLMKSLAFWS